MELENSRKRNTTSNIIKLFFCMCFVFVAFLFKNNINAATYGILEYKEINNGTEIEITGCDKNATGTLNIPSTINGKPVTSIATYAFKNCSNFTGSLVIPDSVTSIGEWAFNDCSGFTGSLVIPNSVTRIGNCAFTGCSGFTGDLVIPDSVTRIDSETFLGCTGFNGKLVIPNSVTSIGEWAFCGCSSFTGSLVIPNSVTSIGGEAFSGCSGFTGSLVIPNSVTSIGSSAFSDCSGFTGSLVIPNSVTSIGKWAFSGCSGFTGSLVIPDSVTSIGAFAFSSCSGFNGSLVISDSVTSIGKQTFDECKNLTGDLIIPNSVTSIGDYAFSGCSGFTGSLVIPDSVTSIGAYAFSRCSGFTGNLVIPNSVTSIGDWTFRSCSGFTGDLIIPDSVTSIGERAFDACKGFNGKLLIPDSVTSIGEYAFNDCSKIKRVVFYADSPEVGIGCFASSSCPIYYRKATTGFTTNNNYDVSRLVPYELKLVNSSIKITDFSNSKYIKLADYDYDFIGDLVKGISYTSDDENIASVKSDGRIITKRNGKTKVNAIVSMGNSTKVILSENVDIDIPLVTSISLDKEKLDFIFTNTQKINATVLPNAAKKTLEWTSSNESVAVVDQDGVVRAISNGNAIITCVTTDGTNISKSVNVTVSGISKGFSSKGDINNDGKVDLVDVFLVYNYYLKSTGNTSIDENLLSKVDLNGDKKIDLLDVYLTYNIYLKRSSAANGFSLTYKVGEGGKISDSSRMVVVGEMCKASATPNTGYKFVGWYVNDKIISPDSTMSFTMPNGDTTVEARFVKIYVSLVRQMSDYTSDIIGDNGFSITTVAGKDTIVYASCSGIEFSSTSSGVTVSYSDSIDGPYENVGSVTKFNTYTSSKAGYYKFMGSPMTIKASCAIQNDLKKVTIAKMDGGSSFAGNKITTGAGGNIYFRPSSDCVLTIESVSVGGIRESDTLDGTYTNGKSISKDGKYNLESGKYYCIGEANVIGYIKDLNESAVYISK